MTIIALKVFLTIWALFWFVLLGWCLKKSDFDVWLATFSAWVVLVICIHLALLIPFSVFSWIWFGF